MLILAQASSPASATSGPALATAADFPEAVQIRPMWMIALMIHKAAHPPPDPATGKPQMAIWPPLIGEGLWPKMLAVAVFAAELGGGVLVLLGLFTRFGAFATASVMLGAMWLTQFGPAIQSGNTRLGFLPAHDLLPDAVADVHDAVRAAVRGAGADVAGVRGVRAGPGDIEFACCARAFLRRVAGPGRGTWEDVSPRAVRRPHPRPGSAAPGLAHGLFPYS